MSNEVRDQAGVLRAWWNDELRTYTQYDEAGVEIDSRPYTNEESLLADISAQALLIQTNRNALLNKARIALTANANFLALGSPTNAQVLAQVRMLTREVTALIKLELNDLLNTDGT